MVGNLALMYSLETVTLTQRQAVELEVAKITSTGSDHNDTV